ncbi:MAG TPA: sulfatase-like hydrolase/transferase [Kofleriaceae bacterium]|nr:sulfatase-like hydrolase/transferase [Kofleriaceae bacterium]
MPPLLARAFLHVTSAVFRARQLQARFRGAPAALPAPARPSTGLRRRNILFITVDQQRFDALRVLGGTVARTPELDALGREGVIYRRAFVHNVVCMPSRATMLTGQYPRTHGVIANGIPLPDDAPSVAEHLRTAAGYRTALVGKAHFDPHLDPWLSFAENRLAARGTGPWRGFEHVELATHGPLGGHHYAAWLRSKHSKHVHGFAGVLTGAGGGDTRAPEVAHNHIPRELYHTDWVADRTCTWLRSVPTDEPFFCWMSFPDPHHPFDPPYDEVKQRIDWRDVPLAAGHPGSRERIEELLAKRPAHWLGYWKGTFRNAEGGPTTVIPSQLTMDQLREMTAMIHVENELIDEAVGRVLALLRERGVDEHTDIIFTSDHGELQGDHGLVFKGPYHVDGLLRVPLLWRPAPSAGLPPGEVRAPVGNVMLAPTFCAIAGLDVPAWMDGTPLPASDAAPEAQRCERIIATFDSNFAPVGMHLRTIYRDGHLCTVYEPTTTEEGGHFPIYWRIWRKGSQIPRYDGSEGELYACDDDPHQHHNLWDDPARRRLRDELVADLREHLPPLRRRLRFAAPT